MRPASLTHASFFLMLPACRPLQLCAPSVETSELAHQRSRMPMRGRASSLSPAPSCTIAAANRATKSRFSPLVHKPLVISSSLSLHTPHVGSRSTAAVAAGSLRSFPQPHLSPLLHGQLRRGQLPAFARLATARRHPLSAPSLSSLISNACAVVSCGAATCAVGPFVAAALAALTPPSPWFTAFVGAAASLPVQSGKGMQVHRGTTTFDRHAVGTSREWVGMSGTPWVRYMDVPDMLFPACAMKKPLGVVEWER